MHIYSFTSCMYGMQPRARAYPGTRFPTTGCGSHVMLCMIACRACALGYGIPGKMGQVSKGRLKCKLQSACSAEMEKKICRAHVIRSIHPNSVHTKSCMHILLQTHARVRRAR